VEYKKITDIEKCESILTMSRKKILLHFDMDYFNNRYNASSDWMHMSGFDPNLELQFQHIECIVKNLRKILEKNSLVYVLIGLSPSFYPVEFWHDALGYLTYSLLKIGVQVRDLRKYIGFDDI
jgi:hypothetical protein